MKSKTTEGKGIKPILGDCLEKMKDKKKIKELEWEKDFDKEFIGLEYLVKDGYHRTYGCGDRVKYFIKDLLTQQRTELLEEIKDLQTYVLFNDTEKLISLEEVKSLLNKKDE